jgi:hypothetical protein
MVKSSKERFLGQRTRIDWLQQAHQRLDRAVFAAYRAAYRATTEDPAWQPDMDDETLLEKLLELNLARAG